MSQCQEVFVDQMSVMSIGGGGTIAKLVFVSNVPEISGSLRVENKLVVTIPVNQLRRMIQEIQNAGIEPEANMPLQVTKPRLARRPS